MFSPPWTQLRDWVHELTLRNVEVGSSYLSGAGAYPQRSEVLVLTGRFLDDYLEMIDRWAAWAGEVVSELAGRSEPGRAGSGRVGSDRRAGQGSRSTVAPARTVMMPARTQTSVPAP